MGTSRRALIPTALAALLVVVLLGAGGIAVRRYVQYAFAATQGLHAARGEADNVLTYQLDEETGVRGLAATGDEAFLEPYDTARTQLGPALDKLARILGGLALPQTIAPLSDAREVSDEWTQTVAAPIVADPKRNGLLVQLHGKELMDRFRRDIDEVKTTLEDRDDAVRNDATSAIDRINLFIGGAIALVLIAALIYGAQQVRLAARLEAEEERSESERRNLAEARAAYVAEKRIADTLQEAFTQRPLPTLPALRFSATYVPATEDTKVGGDWYDALELPDDRVLFAIGDVTGHGIEAAVTMNRARQSLISAALVDADPAGVLERVNREMIQQGAPLVTAIAGFADSASYEFVYAIAGHPPPVLIEPGREPRLLACGSLPLGALAETEYRTHRIQTVPGATLILYTDGAVEHSHDVLAGEALLLSAAAQATEAQGMDPAPFIHQRIFANHPIGDDVAILTIGFAANPPRAASGAAGAHARQLRRASPIRERRAS